MHGNMNVKF